MKLKYFAMILVAVSMIGTAFLQINANGRRFFVRGDSRKEAIKEKQEKAREWRRRHRTMFASKAFDSVKANQMLLTIEKKKIALQ